VKGNKNIYLFQYIYNTIQYNISGGGKVPVEEKEDDNTKVNISLQVSSDEELA
jgi:hypothetical protein